MGGGNVLNNIGFLMYEEHKKKSFKNSSASHQEIAPFIHMHSLGKHPNLMLCFVTEKNREKKLFLLIYQKGCSSSPFSYLFKKLSDGKGYEEETESGITLKFYIKTELLTRHSIGTDFNMGLDHNSCSENVPLNPQLLKQCFPPIT